MLINGIKFACNTCVKGHRSSNCNHIERPLFEIRKKGRPVTQCAFCRDLRKTRQIHIKCTCTDKSKNIENTATTCYQCPSTTSTKNHGIGGLVTEEQGLAYSDLIQNSSLNSNPSQDKPIQCTCHEAANKIILSQQQQQQEQLNNLWSQTPILTSTRPRSMTMEEVLPGYSSYNSQLQKSASFRFLGGQTKSPRRKSSTSSSKSSGSRRRSGTFSHQQTQYQNVNPDDSMMDMQTFAFNQQTNTEMEKSGCAMMAVNNSFPSASSTSTSISNSSTPNSNYNNGFHNHGTKDGYSDEIDLMMNTTDPDQLTSLLNNVLDNESGRQHSEDVKKAMIEGSVNMARSTTSNSFSSSSSSHQALTSGGGFGIPQTQHTVCGSFAPHSNCAPAIDSQGESVVITITPISTLLNQEQLKQQMEVNNKPFTRVVTCYCGYSCICPGCFVHPNNYLNQHVNMQQPFMQLSSNSSSYSSDDEEQHHFNYASSNTTNYSLL
ncbi:unnamed protein product [Mucor hiemalis]